IEVRFITFEKPHLFRKETEAFLLENEAKNNLPLGIIYQLEKSDYFETNPFMAMVEVNNNIELVMVMTPPHSLVFSACQVADELIPFTIEELSRLSLHVPGIIGEKSFVRKFAKQWSKENSFEVIMNQRIYRLDEVNDISLVNGKLISADRRHILIVGKWIKDFTEEAIPTEIVSEKEATEKARRFIEDKTIFLWSDNGSIVSMAKKARPCKNGIVVNLVYTPREYRKKGYATACVALLSKKLLKKYKFCALYTDLANPVSNHIYQEIGYKPVIDSCMIKLD
ncbi:GNAT family N-acetyltransferase, partial [Bacillaceae bacterium Marseille-Q3522]|nr:GNAT family N-acetyltransferase [Bacillaceae bacterium Marseille-Q3522]